MMPLKVVAFNGAKGARRKGTTTKSSVDAAEATARPPSNAIVFMLIVIRLVVKAGLSLNESMENAELELAPCRLLGNF